MASRAIDQPKRRRRCYTVTVAAGVPRRRLSKQSRVGPVIETVTTYVITTQKYPLSATYLNNNRYRR